jgi:hypothetical protein
MDSLELFPFDLDCPIVTNSPSLTDIELEFFPSTDESFIENSCSNDSCYLILSSNHEYVLEDILYCHIVQRKKNHADLSTSREEINIQDIPLLSQ